MSDLLERSVARRHAGRDPARTLEMLATLFVGVLAVTALYVGRDIFVPIAIAILLSFVLSPPILLLRRLGLNRAVSVVIVVLASLLIAFTISAVLTRQVSDLAVDLPKYETTINAKIGRLRDAVTGNALFRKGATAFESIGENPNRTPASEESSQNAQRNILTQAQEGARPVPVEVHEPSPGPFTVLRTVAGTALSPLETIGIVVIFVIFVLFQREDLRNRFIRLVGSQDLQRTTVAMNDAAGRLSRFFLVQTLVNASFGVIVALGALSDRGSEPDPVWHRRVSAAFSFPMSVRLSPLPSPSHWLLPSIRAGGWRSRLWPSFSLSTMRLATLSSLGSMARTPEFHQLL